MTFSTPRAAFKGGLFFEKKGEPYEKTSFNIVGCVFFIRMFLYAYADIKYG